MDWEDRLNLRGFVESEIHAHCPDERADLFRSAQEWSVELEVMDMLYALVRLFKPEFILDTGTHLGLSAAALAVAAQQNGLGQVMTIERDPQWATQARRLFEQNGLASAITLVQADSLSFLPTLNPRELKFDFAFFDSHIPTRGQEFRILYDRGMLRNLVGFHDTSRLREQSVVVPGEPQDRYLEELDRIESGLCRGGLECAYSRGVRFMQLDPNKNPALR